MSRFASLVAASQRTLELEPVVTTSLVKRLGLTGTSDRVFREAGRGWGSAAVEDSEDLQRILAMPRREPPTAEAAEALVEKWTRALERPDHTGDCSCGIRRLFPIQAQYFEEAQAQGVLGHIVIGGGKTLVDCLLAMVVPGVKSAVVMIPSSLRPQFYADFTRISEHFRTPNLSGHYGPFFTDRPVLHVLTYSQLSTARFATILKAKAPDMIILDEAQSLKDFKATRTGRFLRYMADNLGTKLYAHSGSLTTRSLADYGHLSALALREGSPLPLDPSTLRSWCNALDPDCFAPVGVLRKLCTADETARQGFRRRLIQTPGVIVTEDARLPVKLILRERKLEVPAEVRQHLASIKNDCKRPDGEELVEAIEVAACLRQMAAGCYYFWRYPRGESGDLINDWFKKRSAWHRVLREKLKHPTDHADSPLLLSIAAQRALDGEKKSTTAPVWSDGAEAWAAWKIVRDLVKPETDAKFVSDFMVDDAVAWGKANTGIIWFDHTALGHHVAERGGFPYYGGGAQASSAILQELGTRTIVASIAAHGTGKNLQMFKRALVTTFPASDGVAEQLLGRLHRQGQTAPEVIVDYYAHTAEEVGALEQARGHAKYVHETTGALHRLLFAEWATTNIRAPGGIGSPVNSETKKEM